MNEPPRCEHVKAVMHSLKAALRAQEHNFVSMEFVGLHCHVCSAIFTISQDVIDSLAQLAPEVEREHGKDRNAGPNSGG